MKISIGAEREESPSFSKKIVKLNLKKKKNKQTLTYNVWNRDNLKKKKKL